MNIYVGNLSYKLSENELEEVFQKYGTVNSAKIILDKYSGRSKGFGFVEMEDDASAKKAIEELIKKNYNAKDWAVKCACAELIGELNLREDWAINVLEELSNDLDSDVKKAALESLKKLKEQQ